MKGKSGDEKTYWKEGKAWSSYDEYRKSKNYNFDPVAYFGLEPPESDPPPLPTMEEILARIEEKVDKLHNPINVPLTREEYKEFTGLGETAFISHIKQPGFPTLPLTPKGGARMFYLPDIIEFMRRRGEQVATNEEAERKFRESGRFND